MVVARAEEHIKSMDGLDADQSLTSPSGAGISDTTATARLRSAEHHQKGV